MTLLPEPREARTFRPRARLTVSAEESPMIAAGSPNPWRGLGFSDDVEPVEEMAAAVRQVHSTFRGFVDSVQAIADSVDWDGLFVAMSRGAKGKGVRLHRKRARIAVRRRAKAARINSQPSQKGKSPWAPKAGA